MWYEFVNFGVIVFFDFLRCSVVVCDVLSWCAMFCRGGRWSIVVRDVPLWFVMFSFVMFYCGLWCVSRRATYMLITYRNSKCIVILFYVKSVCVCWGCSILSNLRVRACVLRWVSCLCSLSLGGFCRCRGEVDVIISVSWCVFFSLFVSQYSLRGVHVVGVHVLWIVVCVFRTWWWCACVVVGVVWVAREVVCVFVIWVVIPVSACHLLSVCCATCWFSVGGTFPFDQYCSSSTAMCVFKLAVATPTMVCLANQCRRNLK